MVRLGVRAIDSESADLRRSVRLTIAASSIAVLSVGLPAYLLAEIPDQGRSEAWVITLLIMVWGGIRLSLTWVSGRPQLFDFFFWIFTYIFMGLAPTAQIRADAVSTTTPGIDSAFDVPTAGIVTLGIGCYELARLGAFALQHARPRTGTPSPPRGVSPVRTAVLAVVGVAVSAYFVTRIGAAAALGSREAAFAARNAQWPDPAIRAVMYASSIYPLLIATGALAQLRRTAVWPTVRRVSGFAALGAAVVLLMVVNPIASARYTFGTVAFALAVFAGAMATRLRARLTMLVAIVGFLFVFPIADAFRSDEVRVSRTSFFGEYLSNPDYDAFWQIANALSYWIDGLVEPGRQVLGNLLFWVPRAIWPDKPTDSGIVLAEYRGYSFDNLSAPMWAEALINGGIVAVVLVFLALGFALRVMDVRIVVAFASGGVWAIVGAVFPVFMTILMRGSLLQATGATMVMIACLLFVAGGREGPPATQMPDQATRSASRSLRYQSTVRRSPSARSTAGDQPVDRSSPTSSSF